MDPSVILANHSWWHTHGETVVWIAAVVAALGVIIKTPIGQFFLRAVKWVWRRIVSEPITEWSKRTVGAVVEDKITHQFENNGGNSLRDAIDSNRSRIAAIHGCLDRRFAETDGRIQHLTELAEKVLVEQIGSKERVRQLYRVIEKPVFETDTNGWHLYVNPAYVKMTGLSVEQAVGEGWAESLHPEDRTRVFETFYKAVQQGIDFNAVYRFRNVQTGTITEVRGSASPLHDGDGTVVGFIGTLDPLGVTSPVEVSQRATMVDHMATAHQETESA